MTESRERRLLLLLAAVQFTHVLDFMVMLPLGPQLMRELHIGPAGFSALLGCYSVASGLAGFLGPPSLIDSSGGRCSYSLTSDLLSARSGVRWPTALRCWPWPGRFAVSSVAFADP